jgi:hypothetical protein
MIPIRNAVPYRYPPVVMWMLVATNCLVLLFQESLSPDELELLLREFALIPARYTEAFAAGDADFAAVDFFPFFSMMFLHGGWLHLILNMDAVAVRTGNRGSAGSWPLPGVLSCLRPRSLGRARHLQSGFDRPRIGRLRRHRRHSRLLYAAVSAGAGRGGRSDPVHSAVLRSPRVCLHRALVPGAGFAVDDGTAATNVQRRRRRMVGPCRRVHRGADTWPLLARSEQRYRVYYPDEGVLGFETKGRI